MKCLTICQPWAELIARGEKRIENRVWQTHYRGELAIHAGRGTQWLDVCPMMDASEAERLPRGVVVATCRLVDCVPVKELLQRLPVGDPQRAFASGPWCWILADVERLAEPVPARGRQMLWEWTP